MFVLAAAIYVMAMFFLVLRFMPIAQGVQAFAAITSSVILIALLVIEIKDALWGDDIANVCAHMLRRNGCIEEPRVSSSKYRKIGILKVSYPESFCFREAYP